MKSSPIKLKQKLSPKASAAKKKRDLAAANSPYRKAARASSQRAHRANPSKDGMDYDHKTSTFKSAKANRGNDGKGTKVEGKSNYKIKN
jgi:hypothetical protein